MSKRRSRGEGTIYQRPDGLWCAQITMPDGRRKTKYNKSQKIVRDWMTTERQSVYTSTWSSSSDVTLAQFLDRYLNDVAAHRIRPSTVRSYTNRINLQIVPHLGKLKLTALRPDHLQKFYADLQRGGSSSGTVLICHSVLHQSLDQAVAWNLIGRNPADLVKVPRKTGTDKRLLTMDELKKLLDFCRESWIYPVIVLGVTTGMRKGEIAGLHWEDVHLAESYLEVKHGVMSYHGQNTLIEPKTARSLRRVTLPGDAVQALTEWRSTCRSDVLVFPNSRGELLNTNTINRTFEAKIKQAGVPHVPFHSLRHLSATLLLERGISPRVVQERLGHASVSITLGIYSHVTPRLEREAADAIQQALR